MSGDLLVERYRIVTPLANGANGTTYRAFDRRAGRDVALKLIVAPAQRYIQQEALRLSRLEHPQLPKLFDHFRFDEGQHCLVWEYIDGVSLLDLQVQYGALPASKVTQWLGEAIRPISYLHAKNQLHLDIKPANIRVRPNGNVILVDSGLPGLGIAQGASGFAAPEQQSQKSVTAATDQYALGATLYALLTNREPTDALKRQAGLEELHLARDVNPNVPAYLSMVAQRAMSLKPELRFENLGQMAKGLDRPNGSPEPLPPTIIPPARKIPQRQFLQQRRRRSMERRTIYALLSILAILLFLGAGWGVFNLDDEGDETPVADSADPTPVSVLAQALTEIAPTPTVSPTPTVPPTATPEPIIDESTGASMVFVPGGVFQMGGNDEEDDDDMQPMHRVTLDPYFIDLTEVTNAQYATCVADGICTPPQSPNATYHPAYYGDENYDDYPVIFVNWNQSQQFCEWRGGRLPTEAEWEFAAGFRIAAAEKTKYPWGNAMPEAVANFCDVNCSRDERDANYNDEFSDTAPVTSFEEGRSPFGLYNMSGNVMEWVFDWYDPDYYAESAEINPSGPAQGTARVLRGGSWYNTLQSLEVARRGSYVPEVARATLGFRCARIVE